MSTDSEKLSRLLVRLFDNLADMEEELLTYKTLVSALQQVGKFDPSLEEQREGARAAARNVVKEKYAPIRNLLDSLSQGQNLLEFLENWEPGGASN